MPSILGISTSEREHVGVELLDLLACNMSVAGGSNDFDPGVRPQDVGQQAAHQRRIVHDQYTNPPLPCGICFGVSGCRILESPVWIRYASIEQFDVAAPAALLPMLARYNCSWWLMMRFSTGRSRRILTRPVAGSTRPCAAVCRQDPLLRSDNLPAVCNCARSRCCARPRRSCRTAPGPHRRP